MLRVRFLKDVILTDNYETCKKDNERDFEYDLSLELYKNGIVDILNPFTHEDLSSNVGLYRTDWDKFIKEVKHAEFRNG